MSDEMPKMTTDRALEALVKAVTSLTQTLRAVDSRRDSAAREMHIAVIARLEDIQSAIVAPKPKLVNGRNDEAGRHELLGGLAVEVDEETKRRAQNTWAVLRFIGGAIVTAIAAGGWILHYLGAK